MNQERAVDVVSEPATRKVNNSCNTSARERPIGRRIAYRLSSHLLQVSIIHENMAICSFQRLAHLSQFETDFK